MVGIIDYGVGNLLSVTNALERVGADVILCHTAEEIESCERLVLPGVGAFQDCLKFLSASGMQDALTTAVLKVKKPVLGICVGMQMMASKGYEGGIAQGLGWLDAEVVPLQVQAQNLRVPHVGWNSVSTRQNSPLFAGLPEDPEFYFVHSFWMRCASSTVVDSTCDYGGAMTASVRQNNIAATQFHPEKSQQYGLQLLENFLNWTPVLA